jgi:hypothetical protein
VTHDRSANDKGFVRRVDDQPTLSDRIAVIPSCDEHDIAPGARQQCPDAATDRPGTQHDETHVG